MRITFKHILNLLIIMLMPIMKYINFSSTKVNFALSDVVLVLLALIIIHKFKSNYIEKKYRIFILYFTGLILSLFISQINSMINADFLTPSSKMMLLEMLKTIIVAAYFFGSIILVDCKKKFRITLIALSFSCIPVILIGMVGYISNINKFNIHRFNGTFEDPNLCALYFIMVFYISYLNYKTNSNKLLKFSMLGISLLSIIIIGLTLSRGGWLAFVVSLFIFLVLNIKFFKKETIFVFIFTILFLLISLNFDFMINDGNATNSVINRIQSTFRQDVKDNNRVHLMEAAFEMGNDNPIFGVGKGGFQLNSNRYIPKDSSQYNKQSIPHNTLLGFYAQQGFIGLGIFLLLPIFILYKLLAIKKRQNVYFISLFIAFFIHSMTINIENIRFVWYILGLIVVSLSLNFELEFIDNQYTKKVQSSKLLFSMMIFVSFMLYINLSRYLVFNIYIDKGNVYRKTIKVDMPGEYILNFDVETSNNLNYVKIKENNNIKKEIILKNSYGILREELYIEDCITIEYISNTDGWMKVSNAYLCNNNIKIPLNNYILIPTYIEKYFNDKNLLIYLETEPLKKNIMLARDNSNIFHLLKAKVIKYSNLTNEFEFDFLCLKEPAIDYQLDLLIEHTSISNLLPNETQRNNWSHRFTIYPVTSQWKTGNIYRVRNSRLSSLKDFRLYGRFFDSLNNKFENEDYYPIEYTISYEEQNIANLGKNTWVNVRYYEDDKKNIHLTYNGWVETRKFNFNPGEYKITFSAKGSYNKGEYSRLRIRDSHLNIIDEFELDGIMKEYSVSFTTETYQEGISFILELINYEYEDDMGNRNVILQDTFFVEKFGE